jgi:CheY-like chemotaxis protein
VTSRLAGYEYLTVYSNRPYIKAGPLRNERFPMPQNPIYPQSAGNVSTGNRQPEEEIKMRIVLVDDHEVVRNGIATLISREPDFEIVGEFSDGESAINFIRKVQTDAVLMDVCMPIMNGIEATRLIHEEFADIRIIGFSIHDDELYREAIRNAGASECLSKSVSAKDLFRTLRACK